MNDYIPKSSVSSERQIISFFFQNNLQTERSSRPLLSGLCLQSLSNFEISSFFPNELLACTVLNRNIIHFLVVYFMQTENCALSFKKRNLKFMINYKKHLILGKNILLPFSLASYFSVAHSVWMLRSLNQSPDPLPQSVTPLPTDVINHRITLQSKHQ